MAKVTWRTPAVQWSVLGVVVLVGAVWLLWPGDAEAPAASPAALFDAAMTDDDAASRERAAVELAGHPDKPAALVYRLLRESDDPQVRAAAAQGLGRLKHIDAIPDLIAALESDSSWLAGRAGAALQQITGLDAGFRPDAPSAQRAAAAERYRAFWADIHKPDSKFIEYMNDPQKADESARNAAGAVEKR